MINNTGYSKAVENTLQLWLVEQRQSFLKKSQVTLRHFSLLNTAKIYLHLCHNYIPNEDNSYSKPFSILVLGLVDIPLQRFHRK